MILAEVFKGVNVAEKMLTYSYFAAAARFIRARGDHAGLFSGGLKARPDTFRVSFACRGDAHGRYCRRGQIAGTSGLERRGGLC
jgi:hypothetical protein